MRQVLDQTHAYSGEREADAPPIVTGPVIVGVSDHADDDAALRAAGELAARFGVPLVAVAAVEPMGVWALGGDAVLADPRIDEQNREEAERSARERLCAVLPRERWTCMVEFGTPARVLARAAEKHGATLVVVGAGRHGIAARLLGDEVALQVLRADDRPVLAVPPGWRGLPSRVVVAMDFSPASVRAARLAARLLAEGGSLSLVHVDPPLTTAALLGDTWREAQAQEVRDRFARLRRLLDPLLPPRVHVEEQSRAGLVLDELFAVERAEDAQLLAVGTQGRGFLERLWVGSVATGVLRRATCAVLAAPAPAATERAWTDLQLRGDALLGQEGEWGAVLADFTRRHAGRRSWLEVDDPGAGAQIQQRGLAFAGAAWDRHDHRVILTFHDALDPTRHLTRDIPHVSLVAIRAGTTPADEVLCLGHGRGQTLVGFVHE